MSSGFNFGQAPGNFTFGGQKTTAASTGFGLTNSAPVASGGGFTFGTAVPQTNNTAGGGLSFGTPAKGTAPGGGFTFGTPSSTAAATFGLGAAPQTTPAPGLTLGSTATPASGTGFTLGGGLASQIQVAAPAGGGFPFGTAPPAATASAPVAAATAAAAAATAAAATTAGASGGLAFGGGFSFGSTKVQMTTAAPAAPTGGGGGFTFGTSTPATLTLGTQPQAGLTTTAASIAPTLGAGFAFGIKPSTTPAPTAATQPAAAPTLFSSPFTSAVAPASGTGITLGSAATSAAAASTAPATTTAAAGGLAFMLKPLGAAATTATCAPASTVTAAPATTGFTLGVKPAPTTSTAITSLATTIPTSTAPPVMSYAQLEGLINKWSLELEDQERHFLQQATQVNAWDRMLVENGEKITSLHKEMEKVKLDQRRLNQELDFILSQQKELEDLLCPLEESVKEQSGTIYMQNADEERERTYKLAENVDAQLKRMSQDLKEIIEHLNTSSGPADTSDPVRRRGHVHLVFMDTYSLF